VGYKRSNDILSVEKKMSTIKDRILYSKEEPYTASLPELKGNLGEHVLSGFEEIISKHGEADWLINGPYSIEGQTMTCGFKKKTMLQAVKESRRIGAALFKAGLRKGDVVHFAIPNCTEYHTIAIGVWLCEAITSLGDPGVSGSVLKTHLEDTKAKMIICYQGCL
jgi:hypothetical protein